jgi:hypothetical protein
MDRRSRKGHREAKSASAQRYEEAVDFDACLRARLVDQAIGWTNRQVTRIRVGFLHGSLPIVAFTDRSPSVHAAAGERGAHDVNTAAQAYAPEEQLGEGELLVRSERRGQVPQTQIVALGQRCANLGAAVSDDATEAVGEQLLGRIPARQVRLRHQKDVDLAARHLNHRPLGALQDFKRHKRCHTIDVGARPLEAHALDLRVRSCLAQK